MKAALQVQVRAANEIPAMAVQAVAVVAIKDGPLPVGAASTAYHLSRVGRVGRVARTIRTYEKRMRREITYDSIGQSALEMVVLSERRWKASTECAGRHQPGPLFLSSMQYDENGLGECKAKGCRLR